MTNQAVLTPPTSPYPTTSGELITVMPHFRRAEIARMAGWRDRIDPTTNGAITVAGASLSVALSAPNAHPGILLFAVAPIALLLTMRGDEWIRVMAIGPLPGWGMLAGVGAFFSDLVSLCFKPLERDHRLMGGSAHV